MNESLFLTNCKKYLQEESNVSAYYEFMSGGDSFYGGIAPIEEGKWMSLPVEEKAIWIENTINVQILKIRYPGTYSGPSTEALRLLEHLDKVEELYMDSMQVESYVSLLTLPKLDKMEVDVFAHTSGYYAGIWTVFDALIHAHRSDFHSHLSTIGKFRKELSLADLFAKHEKHKTKTEVIDDDENKELNFITLEYLYQHHSK